MIQVRCFKDASATFSAMAPNHRLPLLRTSPAPTADLWILELGILEM